MLAKGLDETDLVALSRIQTSKSGLKMSLTKETAMLISFVSYKIDQSVSEFS